MKAKIINSRTGFSKIFTISDLSGGLNKKASVYDTKDNEAIGLVNFVFTETGLLKCRNGYIKYNSIEIPDATGIHSLFRYYKKDGSTAYFIASATTNLYSGSSGAWTALTCNETLTTNLRFRFAVFKDYLFMTNGANKPLVWSGTGNVRQMGIVAPSAGTTALAAGGSCTDGEHQIRITYYNSTDGIESTHYTLTSRECGSGNNKINLSSLAASDDTQVDYCNVYMTTAGGTTFYRVDEDDGTVADGTSTYTINVSDATLQGYSEYGATNYLPPPTDADYIALSHRRLYLACNSTYPSRLYWSEIDTPEYFASTNYRDISPDDGDWITGILAWSDYLYIFKQSGTYVLTDPADPYNSDLREISRDTGILAPDTLCTGQFQRPVGINDWVLVPGIIGYTRFGVQGFDGNGWYMLSEKVEPLLDNINEPNKTQMVGFFNKGKYYLAYQKQIGDAINSGFVIHTQLTTDSGNENKDATYSTNHDKTSYSSTYDAKIDLSNTSTDYEKELKVKIWIDWAGIDSWVDNERWIYNQCVYYEIFVSTDSASTWESKGVFKQVPQTGGKGYVINSKDCQYYFYHTFVDTDITNIRLDYFKDEYTYLPHITKIRLVSVDYYHDYSLTSVNNNRVLYYDSLHNAWSELWDINANCFCAFNGQDDEGQEYFGSSKSGYVYRMNIGNNDDGNDIFALYHSKHYDCNTRALKKRFQQLTLNTDIYNTTLHIDTFTDRIQRSYHKLQLLPSNADTKYFNEDYFGSVVFDQVINLIQKTFRLSSNCLGRFFNLKIWKSSKVSVTMKDWAVRYIEREGIR